MPSQAYKQWPDSYDVVIIGSGAGGGPMAAKLAQAGLQVLVLEKGKEHSRDDYLHDKLSVQREAVFTPDLAEDPHTLVTKKMQQPIRTSLGWIASCVGGGTVHLGGYYYRFHETDFRMASEFGDYQQLADWPYSYAELEPYYSQAEWSFGVSGQADNNPFAGYRSQAYPMQPLDAHPAALSLKSVLESRHLHPFPTPRCVNSEPYENRNACAYCDLCGGFGCPVGAKGSVQETALKQALRYPNCRLVSGTMVTKITHDETGLASGCRFVDHQLQNWQVQAKVVCVACSAVESARLLLLSNSDRYPQGIGNANGLVGKHLQFHAVSMVQARFSIADHPALQLENQHPLLGQSVMDYYLLPDGVSDINKGGLLRFDMFPLSALENAELLLSQQDEPLWGEALMERLSEQYSRYRYMYAEVFHDFIPNADTFVELDQQTCDKWGLPVAKIHLDLPAHHRLAGQWLAEKAADIFFELGAEQVDASDIGGTSSYLVHGTCRAGNDPQTSVLNSFCQSHQVQNLFVVDGSFMPTSGGAPPTLTILANSLRVADHLVSRFTQGVFI